jgi:hypothetical protein
LFRDLLKCSRSLTPPVLACFHANAAEYVGDATASTPLHFLTLLVASWLRRRQAEALEYLQAENRVLRARLGPKRMRFSGPERRLLARYVGA